MKCEICGQEYKNFGSHISQKHKINVKDYYDKYLKRANEGICLTCGKSTTFLNISSGYSLHCSYKCTQNDPNVRNKLMNTCLNKYGYTCNLNMEDVKQRAQNNHTKESYKKTQDKQRDKYGCLAFNSYKQIETMINKYGVENIMQNKEWQNKAKETKIKKYGTAMPNLKKSKETKLQKYGDENYNAILNAWETRRQNDNLDSELENPDE